MKTTSALRGVGFLLILFFSPHAHAGFTFTILPAPTTLASPTVADFDAGFKEVDAGTTARITLNGPNTGQTWAVVVKTTSVNMGVVASNPAYTKPITDFWFRKTAGSFAQILVTNTNYPVASGASTATFTIDYQVKLAWANDVPATYSMALTYTCTSP